MKKIAIAVLLSAVMVPAVANDMGEMDKHMYVGLRAGPANTNIDNIFNGNNNASGNPTGWGIFVGHIVAQRSKNFLFDLQCVRAVEAVQIEPASMQLTFVLEDGLRRDISEEMAGWNEVLAFVQSRFTGFDRDAYERAKGDVSRVCLCWSKPSSTPSATAAR